MAAVVQSFMRGCPHPPRRSAGGLVTSAGNLAQPSFVMKTSGLPAYRVELPLHGTTSKWSGGKSVAIFDSTILAEETDARNVEASPPGPFGLPAYAEGVRAGLREPGPHLPRPDPRGLPGLNQVMETLHKGPPCVKSGIGIACRDIPGQVAGLPVCVRTGAWPWTW